MGLHVDTAVVPPPERFDYWSSSASLVIHPMNLDREDPRHFAGRMAVNRVGAIDVFHITGDALTVSRTARLIRAHDPEQLNLVHVLRGSCRVRQEGRASAIRPGELCGHDTSRPYTFRADTPFELLLYGIPRRLLEPVADGIRDATATPLNPAAGDVVAMGRDFLRNLALGVEAGTVDGRAPGLADCVAALTRSLYAHPAHPGHPGHPEHPEADVLAGPTPGLFARVVEYIERRLGERDLGPRSVAAAHFVSVRRLQALFHERGDTVSGHIRRVRLERCRRELADPERRGRPIGEIARGCGMADRPHFSRLFRAEYGESPREYRARHTEG
ncbi:MAG TPA: helix-turn-helix domain-containing protein [Pseudonocardia sp.]